jgi:hypothetical protein
MVKPAKNTVQLKNGLIVVTQIGDQTYETMMDITEQIEKLSKDRKSVKILIDHHQAGHITIGARKAGFTIARTLQFDKMAFYGASPYMIGLMNLLGRSTGQLHKSYFAKTYKEAEEWLK